MDTNTDALLQQVAAQQQAEQMLVAMLRNTLQAPAVSKRAATSLVGVKTETGSNGGPPTTELHVALPNGERWEVPLSPDAQRQIIRGLGGVVPTDGAEA